MDVTIVDNDKDREEMFRVMDGHAAKMDGECPDWDNRAKFLRKQWLWYCKGSWDAPGRFVVVDNRDGECFVEEFSTLDGAVLYLCDCYTTCERQEEWDCYGAVCARRGLDKKEHVGQEGEHGKENMKGERECV